MKYNKFALFCYILVVLETFISKDWDVNTLYCHTIVIFRLDTKHWIYARFEIRSTMYTLVSQNILTIALSRIYNYF